LYRRAEAVLAACMAGAERGEARVLPEHALAALEPVLAGHKRQVTAVPEHRYLVAWDRL